jgi:hypothetical protein
MSTIRDTAYPQFGSSLSMQEMENFYTPTGQEITFCNRVVKGLPGKPCFLLLLKSFQKLGYFPTTEEIPSFIHEHILKTAGYQPLTQKVLKNYDHSGTKSRHMAKILNYLGIKPFKTDGKLVVERAMKIALESKDDLVDLINIALEELDLKMKKWAFMKMIFVSGGHKNTKHKHYATR